MKAPKAGFAKYTYGKIQFKGEIYEKEEIDPYIAYQKYKRCEALAKLCAKNIDHLNSEGYIYEKEGHTEELADCIIKTEFYDKWYHRWLELAEKFKEMAK